MTQKRYEAQVRLLLRVLPHVAEEECFALKGGTAINLFVRDLPRLSVDIDLNYVPIEDRETSLTAISEALGRIRDRVSAAIPGVSIPQAAQAGAEAKLFCQLGAANVKIEVNTTMRGTAWPTRELEVVDRVQAEYGAFAAIRVVSHAELFGGKIAAALDRQHPRDLFDVHQLYAHEGLTDEVVQGFLVALISHDRPMHELLAPNLLDQRGALAKQFDGMTRIPFTYDDYAATRQQLIDDLTGQLTDDDKTFLIGFKSGKPDWSLAPVSGVESLPAVQWKLANVCKLQANRSKHAAQLAALHTALAL